MLALGTFRPESDRWQCALCKPYSGEQGAWYTNIVCDDGSTSSFICEHHKHLSLEEIMCALNKRAEDMKDIEVKISRDYQKGETVDNSLWGWKSI